MIAAIYARKSQAQDGKAESEKSVPLQIDRCRAFAVKRGWTVGEIFKDEAISGAEFRKRPGLKSLLAAIESKPKFQMLLVTEVSRLGREQIETAYVVKQIIDEGVRIVGVFDDKEVSIDSAIDKFTTSVQHFASESEREQGSKRVRTKMRALAEAGNYTGGKTYGYTVVNKQRVVNLGEAKIIRRIYQRRLDGAGYFKIAKELENDKITSPRGSNDWAGSTVGDIVTNPVYKGTVVYGKTRQTKKRGTLTTEKAAADQIISREDPTLQIIEPKMWEKVQAVNKAARDATWRTKTGTLKSRPTESKHLLPAFLSCGLCGGSLHVRYGPGGKQYLFCTTRHLYGKKKCSNARRLAVPLAEKALFHAFEEAFVGSIVLQKVQDALDAQRAASQDPEPLRIELRSLKAQIGNLVESLASGQGSATITKAIAEREARVTEIESTLAGAVAVQDIDVEAFRTSVEEALTDWRAHLRKNQTTARQVLAKCLPERLKVTPSSKPGVAWEFDGWTDYRQVLEEAGLSAVTAAVAKITETPCP